MLNMNNSNNSVAGHWLERFIHCAVADHGVSANTREAYTLDITVVRRWAERRGQDLLKLSSADLAEYVRERSEEGLHASTLARHISSCRRFFDFLVAAGCRGDNPALGIRVRRQQPHDSTVPVSAEAVKQLLSPPSTENLPPITAYRRWRDHAIVCLLYGTRLGVSDVRLLRWDQVNLSARTINVEGRAGSVKAMPMTAITASSLVALREAALQAAPEIANAPYCFPTTARLPMSRQALCYTVRKWSRERGDHSVVTPSMLRRSGRVATRRVATQAWFDNPGLNA